MVGRGRLVRRGRRLPGWLGWRGRRYPGRLLELRSVGLRPRPRVDLGSVGFGRRWRGLLRRRRRWRFVDRNRRGWRRRRRPLVKAGAGVVDVRDRAAGARRPPDQLVLRLGPEPLVSGRSPAAVGLVIGIHATPERTFPTTALAQTLVQLVSIHASGSHACRRRNRSAALRAERGRRRRSVAGGAPGLGPPGGGGRPALCSGVRGGRPPPPPPGPPAAP